MKPFRVRDVEGNVMYLQMTSDRRIAVNVPGAPVKVELEDVEGLRQWLADARAEGLQGERWPS